MSLATTVGWGVARRAERMGEGAGRMGDGAGQMGGGEDGGAGAGRGEWVEV